MGKLINTALKEYGTWEWSGDAHNPRVLQYFHDIGHEWVKDDETAWCSAFMNWVALQAGYEFSGKLNARSWLKVGKEVTEPKLGDVVILWRSSPDSWKGHVGLFVNKIGGDIYILGGNQNNQVNISAYNANRLLGYRRLEKC